MGLIHIDDASGAIWHSYPDPGAVLTDHEVIRFIESANCADVKKRRGYWQVRIYGQECPCAGETLADAVREAMEAITRKGK